MHKSPAGRALPSQRRRAAACPLRRHQRDRFGFGSRSQHRGHRRGTASGSTGQRFRAGSVTKTFTATLVLQLVDQKRIGLDDPVGRYLPGVIPAGGMITIRELLQHRSGLANFTDYLTWMDQASHPASIRPIDVLRFAASKPLLFEPGSHWAYSNTNYIALGLVIER